MPVIQSRPLAPQRCPAGPTLLGSTVRAVNGLVAPDVLPAAFGDPPIRITIEAAWGANLTADPGSWVWTDISTDARRAQGVSIRRGKADEASLTQAAQATFGLNNPNGQYTPRNAMGANYPNVRQNTPFRISFNSGDGAFVRCVVFADTYTAGWDQALAAPTVMVSASGILRRLAQGKSPLRSAPYRATLATSPQPLAYWEMSEGFDVTKATCTLPTGGPPLVGTVDIFGKTTPKWSRGDLGAWLPTGVDFRGGGAAGGRVPAMPTGWVNTTGWSADVVINVGSDRGTNLGPEPVLYLTGAGPYPTVDWDLEWQPAGLNPTDRIQLFFFEVNADFTSTSTTLATITSQTLWDNRPHHLRLSVIQVGADINWSVALDGSVVASGTKAGKTLQRPARVDLVPQALNTWPKYAFGHLTLWSASAAPSIAAAASGWAGETATARITRLCTEQGVPLVVPGPSSTLMGAQSVQAFPSLLREDEAADMGILGEATGTAGLGYLPRDSRYNLPPAFVLDMAQRQLGQPFTPVEDDQARRNDWTVGRTYGSTGRYVDSTGPQGTAAAGVYDDSTTVNISSDNDLVDHASWRVHRDTVEQMRYPTVMLNLRTNPELISSWRAADIGSRFTLRNLPGQHQPGDLDLIVEGYTEFCNGVEWTVAINSSAFDAWRVAEIAAEVGDTSPYAWRLETDGSTLAAGINASATSLSIATTTGFAVWTTAADDFPLDINLDGEQIRVTNVTGATSPQTFTVTRSINGVVKAHPINATVSLWAAPVLAL